MQVRSYISTEIFSRPSTSVVGGHLASSSGNLPSPMVSPRLEPRDETIFWLTAAAEIEHFLMTHYLFAAYTLKPVEDGTLSTIFDGLRRTLLQIAREEMGHLITVQNLLNLIGAPLHLGREHSSLASEIYPFRFKLERASLDSLAKYTLAESPVDRVSLKVGLSADDLHLFDSEIADRALKSNENYPIQNVGPLFARLRDLFANELKSTDLRLDRIGRQARWSDWGYKPNPYDNVETDLKVLVHTFHQSDPDKARQAAIDAIQEIGDQGEEADIDLGDGESHFERFFQAYKDFKEIETKNGSAPVWPVAPNPNVRILTKEGASDDSQIIAPRTRRWAQLFNIRYRLLLRFLSHALQLDGPVFVDAGKTIGDRTAKGLITYWSFKEMRRIKKISEKLVQLPTSEEKDSLHAGPVFDLPYRLDIAGDENDRWAGHRDVFRAAMTLTKEMLGEKPDRKDPFLAYLSDDDQLSASIADTMFQTDQLPSDISSENFKKIATILDEAVRGFPISGPHKAFWRDVDLQKFLANPFNPIDPNNPDDALLIQRIAVPEDDPNRMPRYRPRIDQSRINYIRDWIASGTPDNLPQNQIGIAQEPSPNPE